MLGTQIQDNKMRSTNCVIKCTTQKVMAKSGFGRRFHNLKYFEVEIVFFIFLEFTITLRATLRKIVEYINLMQFDHITSPIYLFAQYLHYLSKYVYFS